MKKGDYTKIFSDISVILSQLALLKYSVVANIKFITVFARVFCDTLLIYKEKVIKTVSSKKSIYVI